MTTAIIYARFSPRPDADESDSCEKQKEICEVYCQKHGYEIGGYFEDRGISGSDEDRPGLWAAIDSLKRGYVLVVRWRSRLARSAYLEETLERAAGKRSCRIEAAEEGNGQSDQDKLIRQILAAFREYERKAIAARTKAAMLRYQNRDKRLMGSKPPYGFSVVLNGNQKLLVEDKEEQAVLVEIRTMREDGFGARRIAKMLDRNGYKTRTGRPWNPNTIQQILKRERERG